jgi:hypothetical protein
MFGIEQAITGKLCFQIWVLQVVGSNPASPTNKLNKSSLAQIFPEIVVGKTMGRPPKYFLESRAHAAPNNCRG